MSYSALSDSFEYLCFGLTVIINSLIILKRVSTLDVRISFSVIFNTRKLDINIPTCKWCSCSKAEAREIICDSPCEKVGLHPGGFVRII